MNIFHTIGGADIYQVPIREFPGLLGNTYYVVTGDFRVLIDTGSGFDEANQDLLNGLEEISNLRGEDCHLGSINHVFISHGHIDHIGGLPFIKDQASPQICIHELDQRIVTNHTERLSVAAHRLNEFLIEAGVDEDMGSQLIEMYKITKNFYRSVPVDITYEAIGMKLGPFDFIHVPGHCAGHVLIKLHDVIFSGDHILEKTSPHQAPEQITLTTGLDTYLHSLEISRNKTENVKFLLGGHENPIYHISQRIDEIRLVHKQRLQLILKFLATPQTTSDISKYLFKDVQGYTILLALEETGAHVEYLYQRGFLEIDNLNELEESSMAVPIQYRTNIKTINIIDQIF